MFLLPMLKIANERNRRIFFSFYFVKLINDTWGVLVVTRQINNYFLDGQH